MNEIEFEQELQTIGIRVSQLEEMRTAFGQTNEGFELVLARCKGAANPAGALVTFIRAGAHLKAAAIPVEERGAKHFVCKFCGVLGATTAENHYTNFPEHKESKPAAPLNYPEIIPWIPPEKRSAQDWKDLREAIAARDGRRP